MINDSIHDINTTAYATVDTGTISSIRSSVTFCDGLKEEVKEIVRKEIDKSNKVLMIDEDGIPKWSDPLKENTVTTNYKKVSPIVEEHTVRVNTEKSKEDIKMKKFLKKAFVAIFVAIGIFSTLNYFTGDRIVPFVKDKLETFVDWTEDMWIIIVSNGKYYGRHWDEYTTEYKKKVFRALPLAEQKELMDFLKSGVKEEIKAFEENIK